MALIKAVTVLFFCAFVQEIAGLVEDFIPDSIAEDFIPLDTHSSILAGDDSSNADFTIFSSAPSLSSDSGEAQLWDDLDSTESMITTILPENDPAEIENPNLSLASSSLEADIIPSDILNSWATDPLEEDVFLLTQSRDPPQYQKLERFSPDSNSVNGPPEQAYAVNGVVPVKPVICRKGRTKTCCREEDFSYCVAASLKLAPWCNVVSNLFCCEFIGKMIPSPRKLCEPMEWVEDKTRGRRPQMEENEQENEQEQALPQEEQNSNPIIDFIFRLPALLNGDVPNFGW